MTSNTLKRLDIERQAAADAETKRKNVMSERLKDRENYAKYGSDYVWSQSEYLPSQGVWRTAKDVFSYILDSVGSVASAFKKGGK